VFKSRTLLYVIALSLVIFIVAIVISPVVDIPAAGFRAQLILLLFFSVLCAALQLCVGSILEPHSDLFRPVAAHSSEPELTVVLLC